MILILGNIIMANSLWRIVFYSPSKIICYFWAFLNFLFINSHTMCLGGSWCILYVFIYWRSHWHREYCTYDLLLSWGLVGILGVTGTPCKGAFKGLLNTVETHRKLADMKAKLIAETPQTFCFQWEHVIFSDHTLMPLIFQKPNKCVSPSLDFQHWKMWVKKHIHLKN